MNKVLLTLIIMVCFQKLDAAILRCNNNPAAAGPNVFSTAQYAHDAANAGDTIHLEPTQFGDYGQLDMTKKLTVISTGYWVNESPGSQASSQQGSCSVISLLPGSEFSTISAVATFAYISTNDISLISTYLYGDLVLNHSSPISNILISKCFITNSISNISGQAINNLTIKNNILRRAQLGSSNSSVVVMYNTFQSNCCYGSNDIQNAIFSKNIILYSGWGFGFQNSIVSDNICENEMLPAGNGNQNYVDMSTVFATWGPYADLYQLTSSYPNQDLGAYAGADPYRSAVQPAIPAIYFLQNSGLNNGNNLQIQVSTKSNN